jgi:hypothetical protein
MAASTMPSRVCSARYATRRRPERPTFGPEIAKIGDQLGTPFMPWQRLVADVAGEYDPDTGIPYYGEIIVTVPRQSGKTTLFCSCQCHRCLSPRWKHPQRAAFTAQTGKDARDKWIDELFPMIKASPLNRFVDQIATGMGNEFVRWKTGSIIRLLSSSSSSGHSKTLHQATVDEVWHDTDDRREQGLRPAMITIPDKQLLVCSTAGNATSVVLKRKRRIGREAVRKDTGRGVAYFEFSAPEDWDPYKDEELLYQFHPALCPDPPCRCGNGAWHHTITIDAIRGERDGMELGEFIRAYGNRDSEDIGERVIPDDVWSRVLDKSAAPTGQLRFGIDASADRDAGAIAAGDPSVIELLEHRPGVGWMVERAVELAVKWEGVVVLDASGPIAYMAKDLREKGVQVQALQAGDVAQQCGRMYDDIADRKVTFARRGPLWSRMEKAVVGLAQRPAGDRMVWSREASTEDISPFFAATLCWDPNAHPGAFFLR